MHVDGAACPEVLCSGQLLVLLFASGVVYMDQNMLSPLLSRVASEFDLDDSGKDHLAARLAFGLGLVAFPAGLIVGYLADDHRGPTRVRLLQAVLLVATLGAVGTAHAKTESALFWARVLSGCAIAGLSPLKWSILCDLVGPSQRTRAAAAIWTAIKLGETIGMQLVSEPRIQRGMEWVGALVGFGP
jgi:predicted MFS family arabinose efflux permease